MTSPQLTIGVLALQGAFYEHITHLRAAADLKAGTPGSKLATAGVDVRVIEVRTAEHLDLVDALVLPGGESTSISLIAERTGLLEPLRSFVRVEKKPVWGTCAGLILLSNEASKAKKGGQELIGGLAVRCQRNHFGRQTESFSCALDLPFACASTSENPFVAVFIRAPIVERILPTDGTRPPGVKNVIEEGVVYAPRMESSSMLAPVEVIAQLPPQHEGDKEAGDIVAVRQGNVFGTSFHPELTQDVRLHAWWLEECVLPLIGGA
ncbi:class I glutamine amidotransferase-like protein [Limtongia smithiae]|uniref:class I glutamine amidotransferase-like protein n=1 Tax=Limtongia smithiae TaxID=1125753 RepID=UPI0034CDBC35